VEAERLEEIFERVNQLWEEYRKAALEAISEWEKARIPITERVNVLKTLITTYSKELEELQVKAELGLVDAEKANEKIARMSSELEEYKAELDSLLNILEKFERLAFIHLKRAGLPVPTSAAELKQRIMQLEELFKEGLIDEDTYKRIKEGLEAQLALAD
jgi:uncharacterized coiled-coil DUF342 family protein